MLLSALGAISVGAVDARIVVAVLPSVVLGLWAEKRWMREALELPEEQQVSLAIRLTTLIWSPLGVYVLYGMYRAASEQAPWYVYPVLALMAAAIWFGVWTRLGARWLGL